MTSVESRKCYFTDANSKSELQLLSIETLQTYNCIESLISIPEERLKALVLPATAKPVLHMYRTGNNKFSWFCSRLVLAKMTERKQMQIISLSTIHH